MALGGKTFEVGDEVEVRGDGFIPGIPPGRYFVVGTQASTTAGKKQLTLATTPGGTPLVITGPVQGRPVIVNVTPARLDLAFPLQPTYWGGIVVGGRQQIIDPENKVYIIRGGVAIGGAVEIIYPPAVSGVRVGGRVIVPVAGGVRVAGSAVNPTVGGVRVGGQVAIPVTSGIHVGGSVQVYTPVSDYSGGIRIGGSAEQVKTWLELNQSNWLSMSKDQWFRTR